MEAAIAAVAAAAKRVEGEDEKVNIILRYIRNPLFDDSDLYYNGLCDSSAFLDHRPDLSYKVSVALFLLEQLQKKQKEDQQEEEAEGASKKELVSNIDFPNQVSRTKRSPKKRRVAPNLIPISRNCTENMPKKNRITFKLRGTTVFSMEGNSDGHMVVIPHKPLPKREANKEEEEGIIRAKKRIKKNQQEVLQVQCLEQRPSENNNNNTHIPERLKAYLDKRKVVLVIRKTLTPTDITPNNGRLSIPMKDILNINFLSEEEHKKLEYEPGNKVPHLDVRLIEPSGEVCGIKLKRWIMGNNATYLLHTPWNQVVARNRLSAKTPIELYSFRDGPRLCFALIKVN